MQILRLKIILISIVTILLAISDTSYANQQTQPQKRYCDTAEYRQFDFWIGDWNVFDAKGNKVGENKIFPILNGCALSENWKSVKGNPGVSYNFYDKMTQLWHQTWVDASGGALYLNGKLKGDTMILSGSHASANGGTNLQEISWTPLKDGQVKQHWRVSNDNGKTWKDIFVGFYKKKQ